MWKTIQALLGDLRTAPAAEFPLEVAGLALMMEIARADHSSSAEERKAIMVAARQVFGLTDAEALMGEAETAVEDAVSLHEFTRVLNERLDRATKYRLLEQLWRVAYADGSLDHYEEYYLRKICDLLYLSHRDLIRAKLAVAPGG